MARAFANKPFRGLQTQAAYTAGNQIRNVAFHLRDGGWDRWHAPQLWDPNCGPAHGELTMIRCTTAQDTCQARDLEFFIDINETSELSRMFHSEDASQAPKKRLHWIQHCTVDGLRPIGSDP